VALAGAKLVQDEADEDRRIAAVQTRARPARRGRLAGQRPRRGAAGERPAPGPGRSGGDYKAGVPPNFNAADAAGKAIQDIKNAIDFPTYVSSLISGVFRAITESSIKQVESLIDLLDHVSQPAEDFAAAEIATDAAAVWAAARFPFLTAGDGALSVRGDADLSDHKPEIKRALAATAAEVDAIDDSDLVDTLLPLVRRKLGRDRQGLLATLIQLGLQRVVVDDGRLHASMDMRVDTRSALQRNVQDRQDLGIKARASASMSGIGWGVKASFGTDFASVHSDNQLTKEEIDTRAGLRSTVDLAFRTEQVPLDRLADKEARVKLDKAARVPIDVSATSALDTAPAIGVVGQSGVLKDMKEMEPPTTSAPPPAKPAAPAVAPPAAPSQARQIRRHHRPREQARRQARRIDMSDFTVPVDVTTAAAAEVLRRMVDVTTLDPSLARSVDVVARPVSVLQDILREAGDVLRGDPLAVERLRLLLVLAAPFGRVLATLEGADPLRAEDAETEGRKDAEGQGLIDPGAVRALALSGLQVRALLMIAVAAVRAAPSAPVASLFLQRLLGLALATAPIEALARLDPFDPRDELIREVLRRSVTATGDLDVAAFAADPDELGRWRTLARLLAAGFIRRLAQRWDSSQWQGARTIRVDRILATNIDGQPRLTLLGDFPTGEADDEEILISDSDDDESSNDESSNDEPSNDESSNDDEPPPFTEDNGADDPPIVEDGNADPPIVEGDPATEDGLNIDGQPIAPTELNNSSNDVQPPDNVDAPSDNDSDSDSDSDSDIRPELQPRALSVALVAPGHEAEPVTTFTWSSNQAEISLPTGSLGWFAALDELRDARWRRYFGDLLASLDEFLPGHDIVFGAERPFDWFAAMPQPATPLRGPGATFAGSDPGVLLTVDSDTGELGDRVTVRWDSVGATHVRREPGGERLPPRGELILELTTPPEASVTLTPVLLSREGVRAGPSGTIRVTIAEPRPAFAAIEVRQRGGPPRLEDRPLTVTVTLARALDGALFTLRIGDDTREPDAATDDTATFTIPRDRVLNGLVFTVAVASPRRDGEVTQDIGPLRLIPPRKVAVVLVRPTVVEVGDPPRIDSIRADELAQTLADIELDQDLAITARDLPHRSDALAVLAKQPTSPADPVLGPLIDGLARAAAEAPGAEESLWLAVVPGPGKWAAVAPAEAALAVGVAPLAGLAAALRTAFPQDPPALAPARPRLRILGLVRGDDDIDIADVRREREPRRAGPGAPLDTGFVAICRDDGGNTIAVHPLRAHRPGGSFVALFEATPDLRSVVVQGPRGPGTLVVQPESLPAFTATPDGFRVRWNYSHADGHDPAAARRDRTRRPVRPRRHPRRLLRRSRAPAPQPHPRRRPPARRLRRLEHRQRRPPPRRRDHTDLPAPRPRPPVLGRPPARLHRRVVARRRRPRHLPRPPAPARDHRPAPPHRHRRRRGRPGQRRPHAPPRRPRVTRIVLDLHAVTRRPGGV
jgi:hypothetical protein